VITYQMLFGSSPFFRSEKLTHKEIRESFNRPLEFPKEVSEAAQDFMRRMLVKDPQARMGFE
jgi:serine/threonine protein kinase